jgi:hypothetical protein
MGWFKTEEEIKDSKVIDIRSRRKGKLRRRVSKIEEEGEFVTIEIRSDLLPEVSFMEEEETVEEEENVSTVYISNISE